jgi:hypothetical protein
MKHRIFPIRLDPISYALLGALALGSGCVTAPDEGAYVDPPGFSPRHTGRAAVAPGAFVRVGDAVVTRNQLGRRAGPPVGGSAGLAGEGLELEARFLGTYADGVRVALSGRPAAYIDVLPVGARAVGARVRQDGALVAFEGAFPGVSAAFGADARRVEEFLSIPSAAEVPTLRYRLVPGPDFGFWSREGSSLWAYARDGAPLYRLVPPVAEDATGKNVEGGWRVVEESGGVLTVEPELSLEGLSFPVLFDPTFETPTWFPAGGAIEPVLRAGAAGTFYPEGHDCVLVFGGAGALGVYRQDLVARCAGQWQVGSGPAGIASNAPPEARAYAPMAYAPFTNGAAGAYLFGGYTATGGANAELWRLTLSGAGAKTGMWQMVGAPVEGSGVPWPEPRFLAHLVWSGSNLLLYGGVSATNALLTDVWRYDGASWSMLCAGCYPGRYGSADAALGDVVNAPEIYDFGGYGPGASGSALQQNVLRFNGTTWQPVALRDAPLPTLGDGSVAATGEVAPAPRYLGFAARTNLNQLLVGSGGNFDPCGTGNSAMADAWLWNRNGGESRWLRLASGAGTPTPGRRISPTIVYDPSRNETLFFGGQNDCSTENALFGAPVIYRGRAGSVMLTVTCQDPDLNGGVNGNACDKFVLDARVSAVAGDTSPTRARALFLRRRGSQWVEVGGACGAPTVPMAPTSPNTFRCEVTPFDSGAIDTGFAVEVRDSAFYEGAGGSGQCSSTSGGGVPYCNGAGAYAGVVACANGTASALPAGHLASMKCNL